MCPIETVKPFALMIAPVYVFLRRNQKYVSVKAPLDFFVPDELDRLRSFEMFFMPEFVDSVLPYRQLARRVKTILTWNPVEGGVTLPPASFELADGMLRMTAPVWGGGRGIEAFFATIFCDELCGLLPGEEIKVARDRDLPGFERAVILSAWMVFLSLHIGTSDLAYLEGLRLRSFRKCLGQGIETSGLDDCGESGELYDLLEELLSGELLYGALALAHFEGRNERVAQKIAARIRRVNGELKPALALAGSIHGERGFVDG